MSIYNDKNPKKTQTQEEKQKGCFNIFLGAFAVFVCLFWMYRQGLIGN